MGWSRLQSSDSRSATTGPHVNDRAHDADRSQSAASTTDHSLESFLQGLETPGNHNTKSTQGLNAQTDTPSDSVSEGVDISPAALYPRTMSCRQAFDQAFYCQSLGGKFNDIYRYGSLQSCSENWNQFWFCMRNRTFGGDEQSGDGGGERGKRIADYYADREKRNKALHGSSDDVWAMRTRPVERAFGRNPDEAMQHHD